MKPQPRWTWKLMNSFNKRFGGSLLTVPCLLLLTGSTPSWIIQGTRTALFDLMFKIFPYYLFVLFSFFPFFFCRVMVLDKGFMVEFDTPQALLAQQGVFYSMACDAGLAWTDPCGFFFIYWYGYCGLHPKPGLYYTVGLELTPIILMHCIQRFIGDYKTIKKATGKWSPGGQRQNT